MVEERPRLVLLDMMLPGVDGIALMRDLSAVSRAPVVFLSAYGSDQVIARASGMVRRSCAQTCSLRKYLGNVIWDRRI